ncbi:hypothetical protein GDO86_012554 [Hymenochirus boettgeri]|uniref:Uncharacterized protein n=1 Tax=Hymenochirus boettgeri TaxID=247094 RepID=A0A8T2ISZ8_9PIPI|nr:hypothetical protein GDO86_012554 [Hymenochirus boettgeri]
MVQILHIVGNITDVLSMNYTLINHYKHCSFTLHNPNPLPNVHSVLYSYHSWYIHQLNTLDRISIPL